MKIITGSLSGDLGLVPNSPCQYDLKKNGKIMRNGSSGRCNNRLTTHSRKYKGMKFDVRITKTHEQAHALEKTRCKRNKPPLNKKCG